MTRIQHLLAVLGEEGVEVAQRTSKALRFGLTEVQPGQDLDNATRIMHEAADFQAVYELLQAAKKVPPVDRALVEAKKLKVAQFLVYSEQLGQVTE